MEKNSENPSATTSTDSNTNGIPQTIRPTHSEFGETSEEKKKVREAMMRALNSVRELNVQRPDDPMTFLSEFMLMEDPKLSSYSDSDQKYHKRSYYASTYIQPAIEKLLKQETGEDPAVFLSNYFLSQKESFEKKMAEQKSSSNKNDVSQTIRQTEGMKIREAAIMRALKSVTELDVQRPDDPMTFLSEFMLMEDPKLSSYSDWGNSSRKPHKSSHCAKSYIQPAIEELLKQKTEEDPAIFLSNYFLSQKESFDEKMAG